MENLDNYSVCSTRSKKAIITFKDKGESRKMTFNNPNKLEVIEIKIDGCLINNENILKYDYMLYIPSGYRYKENYVELKGSNIDHAVEQISSTIKYLWKWASKTVQKQDIRKGYIISRRVPRADTSVQRHKLQMKKTYNLDLEVKTGHYTETLGC